MAGGSLADPKGYFSYGCIALLGLTSGWRVLRCCPFGGVDECLVGVFSLAGDDSQPSRRRQLEKRRSRIKEGRTIDNVQRLCMRSADRCDSEQQRAKPQSVGVPSSSGRTASARKS